MLKRKANLKIESKASFSPKMNRSLHWCSNLESVVEKLVFNVLSISGGLGARRPRPRQARMTCMFFPARLRSHVPFNFGDFWAAEVGSFVGIVTSQASLRFLGRLEIAYGVWTS